MIKRFIFIFTLILSLVALTNESFAQQERKYIRKGNKLFDKGNYAGAEVDYLRALDKDSTSYAATFNLADALYKQGKFEDALIKYDTLSKMPSPYAPQTIYNLGNTLFESKKYAEAVEAYKASLRMNPSDTTAKFNLAYAQSMLKNEQDNKDNKDDKENKDNQDNKDNKDNKDNQDNKDNKDNQDNKDNKDDKENKDDKNKDQPKDKKDQGEGQSEPKISKEQAEKMLQAIQSNEDKTQQKVKDKKEKGAVIGGSRKNW